MDRHCDFALEALRDHALFLNANSIVCDDAQAEVMKTSPTYGAVLRAVEVEISLISDL
jgi:hypothetical protein